MIAASNKTKAAQAKKAANAAANAATNAATQTVEQITQVLEVAEQSAQATKHILGAYTREGAALKVALFINQSTNERAPVFGGYIGDTRVSAFVRTPAAGTPFLSFIDGDGVQVATANVRILKNSGAPTLKAVVGKQGEAKTSLWISLRKDCSEALLEKMGTNMERLNVPAPRQAAPANDVAAA